MKLTVEKAEWFGTDIAVTGRTPIGILKGVWKDCKPPLPGATYETELNIEHAKEVPLAPQTAIPAVCLDGNTVTFVGICEEYDRELYYVRLDPATLQMLERDVMHSEQKEGDTLSFCADWHHIGIYPYE